MDEMINEAFSYVFSNVIKHINTASFNLKSKSNRLGIVIKYLFNCITSLFSEDILEIFINLETYAAKDISKNGSAFV